MNFLHTKTTLFLHLLADSLAALEFLEFDVDDSSLLCLHLQLDCLLKKQ